MTQIDFEQNWSKLQRIHTVSCGSFLHRTAPRNPSCIQIIFFFRPYLKAKHMSVSPFSPCMAALPLLYYDFLILRWTSSNCRVVLFNLLLLPIPFLRSFVSPSPPLNLTGSHRHIRRCARRTGSPHGS